ncbi:MAG: hypothetical protein D6689_15410 [Deltaproteobacteria bacterium]|nr:MAG: hypothetical protein D6689_15410 [Deltaproteobacteria bacterium]
MPALGSTQRRPAETEVAYEIRMRARSDYLRFLDEAPGLSSAQEIEVRRILSDAQINHTIDHDAVMELAGVHRRIDEVQDPAWVRTFRKEYEQRLRAVLTDEQFEVYNQIIAGTMAFVSSEPFDVPEQYLHREH